MVVVVNCPKPHPPSRSQCFAALCAWGRESFAPPRRGPPRSKTPRRTVCVAVRGGASLAFVRQAPAFHWQSHISCVARPIFLRLSATRFPCLCRARFASTLVVAEHNNAALNLLDTPGHADFSEDTYRTLAAVDSALMLVDHSKGVESRTLKLFEVCRMRKLPIVTFMNKLDRNGL